ncbi:MAG: hypothetical protein IT331_05995 [Anaerolineae bacterium]|nr:hypothetical protein [Anaerolineae bacterium]
MRLRVILAWFVIVLLLLVPTRAAAQSPIVVTSQTFQAQFPRSMQFAIQVESSAPIQTLRLTVWQDGVALGSRHTPKFAPERKVRAVFEWSFQAFGEGGYLPPGTRGEYTWHIQDAAGNSYDTPRRAYGVEDNTQKWNVLSNDDLTVRWHAGNAAFGQAIFDRAVAAHEFLEHEVGIDSADPLEIFIYADKQEFFDALPAFSAEWTGGRMFPEYGVIMINFAPSQLEWGLRATSHELSHAILHAKIRGTIGQLSIPHWLDEGLAVYNETDDHAPDEQFEEAFQPAVRRNALIPLRSMQLQFPNASEQAQLAYGQSYSVVKYMIQEHGKDKFAKLLNVYERGAAPDDALLEVYGMNQDQLENAWRRNVGAPERRVANSELPTVPIRPTYDISSPFGSTTIPTTVSTPEPTREPTMVSLSATPGPANAIPSQAQELAISSLCLGVIGLSGVVTLVGLKRRHPPRF